MAMVRELHRAGYQRLYLYSWPKPSGLHWRWQLFCGRRNWLERPWREGWYGSGADYNFNPVLGWGEAPGASAAEMASALARFDPQGLAQALGRDEDHAAWFETVCAALLPDYAYSLGWERGAGLPTSMPPALPVIPVRRNLPEYAGAAAAVAAGLGRPMVSFGLAQRQRFRIEDAGRRAVGKRQQVLKRGAEVQLVAVLLDIAEMRRRHHVAPSAAAAHPAASGSLSKTSSAARPGRPCSSAASSAPGAISSARLVLSSRALGFMRARSAASTIARVSSFKRRWREITSDSAKKAPFEAAARWPSRTAAARLGSRPQISTCMPNALP